MTKAERVAIQLATVHHGYTFCHYTKYDMRRLSPCVQAIKRAGGKDKRRVNNIILMADTETSKKPGGENTPGNNHVVAWTISARANGYNLFTLWGHKPDTMARTIENIHNAMEGDRTIIYIHNLPYDYVFLRQFFFELWGFPDSQLNIKPHYPLFVEWLNGIVIKDSLILAQRKLEKWAADLDVEHKKAVGLWDYNKLRTQNEQYTEDELTYIEHDTLAGVECIDKLRRALHKQIYSMPYTATGIPREQVRDRGKKYSAHEFFSRCAPSYAQQKKLEMVFHGGFTHANRHLIDQTIKGNVRCYDFASSYPFTMIVDRFPMERFTPVSSQSPESIIRNSDNYAFMFKLIAENIRLKNDFLPMPSLQYSKTVKAVNPILDNGRILCARYIEIYLTEVDLEIIHSQYDAEMWACVEVEAAAKDYLPRWFRDYVYECFTLKTKLKGGDKVQYALAKATVNSLYGMTVQKPCKEVIEEIYTTGEYQIADCDMQDEYNKYLKKRGTVLPYFWGVWVTAYAFNHLFKLGDCVHPKGDWIYSDTDSAYATRWDIDKIKAYNQLCIDRIKAAGYDGVLHNGREYWLGVAETDGDNDLYTEFRTLGAKRYCGRCAADGELHITVAGVPKKGAACLHNDIRNFTKGTIFDGETTGKLLHTYFFNDIYTDEKGNLTGDSIDLSPCDYLLDDIGLVPDWETLFSEDIEIQIAQEADT